MSNSFAKNNRIINRLFYLLGLFSTMPIVGLPLEGRYLTLFNIFFVLTLVCLFISINTNERMYHIILRANSNVILLLIFFSLEIVAASIGYAVLPLNWANQISSYLLKSLEYVFMFLLIMCGDNEGSCTFCIAFAKGLLLGCIINASWGIMQAVLWYIGKISVNQLLFPEAIRNESQVGIYVNIYYGIRVSGLNTDPAHLGALLPVLLYYAFRKKKTYLIILSLVCLVFSGSTTALVAVVIILILVLLNIDSYKKESGETSYTTLGRILSTLLIIIAFITLSNTIIIHNIVDNVNGFMTRVVTEYGKGTSSIRGIYYLEAFNELSKRLPLALFGTGFGTSGYAYYDIPMAAAQGVFDVESTYLSYIFDVGIIGSLVYILFLSKLFCTLKEYNNNDISLILMGTLLTTIISGISYHYIITSYQIIPLFFMAIVYPLRDVYPL